MSKLPLVKETKRPVARLLQGRAGMQSTQRHSLVTTKSDIFYSSSGTTYSVTGSVSTRRGSNDGSVKAGGGCGRRASSQEVPHEGVAHRWGRGAAGGAAHQDLGRPNPHCHSTHPASSKPLSFRPCRSHAPLVRHSNPKHETTLPHGTGFTIPSNRSSQIETLTLHSRPLQTTSMAMEKPTATLAGEEDVTAVADADAKVRRKNEGIRASREVIKCRCMSIACHTMMMYSYYNYSGVGNRERRMGTGNREAGPWLIDGCHRSRSAALSLSLRRRPRDI